MQLIDIVFNSISIKFHKSYYNLSKFIHVKDYKSKLILNLAILFLNRYDHFDIEEIFVNKMKVSKEIYNRIYNLHKNYDKIVEYMKYDCLDDEFGEYYWGLTKISDYHIRLYLSQMKDDWQLALHLLSMEDEFSLKEYQYAYQRTIQIHDELGGWKVISPISGKHLIEIGFPADKTITEALKALEDELLKDPKMTKNQALEYCKKYLK